MKRCLLPLICACLLLEPAGALASTDSHWDPKRLWVPLSEHLMMSLPGEVMTFGGYATSAQVEVVNPDEVDEVSAQARLQMRLRFAPALIATGRGWPLFEWYRLGVDADLIWDALTPTTDAWTAYEPRAAQRSFEPKPRLMGASFSALGPHVGLNVGLTRSHWGTGMLANGGLSVAPLGFGQGRFADRVARAQLLVFPLGTPRGPDDVMPAPAPLTLALSADAVVDDDTASWLDGDRAYHGVAALLGVIEDFKAGAYVVYRRQDHDAGGDTELTAVDVYLKKQFRAGSMRMFAEFEAAMLTGSTSYSQSALIPGRFAIESGGGVLRIGGSLGGFKALMEAGYASGDDNPYDARLTAFTFDREYKVGLLMFRETLRQTSAVTALNVQDPTYRAAPPRGYERIATSGAVRGASYINPRLSYRLPVGVSFTAGYLHARSSKQYADAFQSSLNGGLPTGPRGALAQNILGDEFDLAITYEHRGRGFGLMLRAEGALFIPGEVFADADNETAALQYGGWFTGELKW